MRQLLVVENAYVRASQGGCTFTLNQTRAIVRGILALAVERYELEDDVSIAFKRAQHPAGDLREDQVGAVRG